MKLSIPVLGLWLFGCFAAPVLISPAQAVEADVVAYAEFFEDWVVTCSAENKESCRLWQKVQVDLEGRRQDVMVVSITPQEETTSPMLVVQTPLDVFLPAGFGLDVDGQLVTTAPFRNCNAAGCWVTFPVSSELAQRLQRGAEGHAVFYIVEGQPIRISFSLRGFTAAWEALENAAG